MSLNTDPALKGLVRDQLDRQEKIRGVRPTRPVTTVRAKAMGGLQIRADVEGHSFLADEREAKGGTDTGPAPLRYFLGGLAMCHQVWCIKSAALADVRLDELESEVSGYLEFPADDGDHAIGRGFSRLEFEIRVESPSPSEQVNAIVREGAERCAAMVTVRRSVAIDLVVTHNGEKVVDERDWNSKA